MDMRVAIIGSGIGGMAAAVGLHRAGAGVIVYEEADRLAGAGTALGLWPGALRALDALGIGDQVRARGVPQRGGAILRADGSRLATIDTAPLERRTGDPVYLLSRPALAGLLWDALPDGVVRFSHPVTGDALAELRRRHDLVIAADGIFSGARAALFGAQYSARYLGMTAWRGVLDGPPPGGFSETWGDGRNFGITHQEGGRTNWFAAAPAPERHAYPGGDLAALREQFDGWHPRVREVLDRITEDELLRHDLYELDPPLPSYVQGNVVLIGDAAHAMSPDLGRGACEALVDAATLVECLADPATPDLGDALSARPRSARPALRVGSTPDSLASSLIAYDRRRRRPTQRLAAMSRRVSRVAHARRFTRLRDVAVRAALAVGGPPA